MFKKIVIVSIFYRKILNIQNNALYLHCKNKVALSNYDGDK